MDISQLVKLTTRAWSINILAHLHDGVPGRQAALIQASGAGRTAFGHSLHHLLDLGLLERNPGHGHPLRPEFRLTARGAVYAQVASRAMRAVNDPAEAALLRRAWTVPILATSAQPTHFSDIKQGLGAITDRALSQSLKHLQAHRWLDRQVDTLQHPPRPIYQAANSGARISRDLNALLREL